MSDMDIETRVTVSLAIQRYLRAAERFESANEDFMAACNAMRETLPKDSRFIANINHKHHLVTVDAIGGFHVEEIATV
jgi:hypothetical protein